MPGTNLTVRASSSLQFSGMLTKQENSLSSTLDMLYNTLIARTVLTEQRTQLIQMIRRSAEYARMQLQSFERAMKEAQGAERHKEMGELLNASAHTIAKGIFEVSLVDYYDPDMKEIQIELDPKLSPRENADRYFKRYRKLKEAGESALARRDEVISRLNKLDAARLSVDAAVNVSQIKQLRDSLIASDLLRENRIPDETASGKEDFEGHRIRRITTPEGWEILYGENSTSNDYLTQKVAKPNDVWLHARSITGAHVVIRTGGHSGEAPPKVLLEGARIAAVNSDAKHSSLVSVDHTKRKFVRKPKGSPAGYVIYRMEKTIDVQP